MINQPPNSNSFNPQTSSSKPTGLRQLFRSLSVALNAWRRALKTEQNLRFHLITTALVIIAGFFFQISLLEWLILILCIGLVLTAELFNTSLEYLADVVRDYGHLDYFATKFTRDISAAAVLTISLISAFIGLIIFIPKILIFISQYIN